MPDLQSIPTPAKTPGDTTWFNHDRFGLFIHWGIYAMAARHEWVKSYEEISDEDYQPYFDHFDPDLYDPDQWAQAAAAAGMKYFAITTKHHDGFCLWDSKLTDYKATNTPAGRDLIKPMVDAFRQQNIRIGFYHSLIDWHHRQFVIDNHHSQRNHPDRQKLNAGRDQSKYIPYLHGQVRELLTEFGRIDLLFLDFSYPPEKGRRQWDSDNLYKLIRELAPDIVQVVVAVGALLTGERAKTASKIAVSAGFDIAEHAAPIRQIETRGHFLGDMAGAQRFADDVADLLDVAQAGVIEYPTGEPRQGAYRGTTGHDHHARIERAGISRELFHSVEAGGQTGKHEHIGPAQ